ncbi:MAG: peptidase, partial [Raineya sp.]
MKKYFYFTLICLLALACEKPSEQKELPDEKEKQENTTPVVKAPDFNADSAFYFIERQLAFGPRVPNSTA